MVDYFSLALTHGLLAIAAWRLLSRADLDDDRPDAAAQRKWAGKASRHGGREAHTGPVNTGPANTGRANA